MSLNWIDVTKLSFNTLLLLEQVQLSWLPGWVPEKALSIALRKNPAVEWYFRNKCPEICVWLDQVMAANSADNKLQPEAVRRAEITVMDSINDLLVYAVDPGAYDALPFLNWDSSELLTLTDFTGKIVLDIGAGTGRLALAAAPHAASVFAVEPVTRLRDFVRSRAESLNLKNVYAVDGLIARIPFPDDFADITMGGHVFGDDFDEQYRELCRVTRTGGMIILCPGNTDDDNDQHHFLVSQKFQWSRFEEPEDGMKRKYWKVVE